MGKSRKFAIEIAPADSQVKSLSQVERFRMLAHDLGCDASETHFDNALKKVERHEPLSDTSAPPKPARPKQPV